MTRAASGRGPRRCHHGHAQRPLAPPARSTLSSLPRQASLRQNGHIRWTSSGPRLFRQLPDDGLVEAEIAAFRGFWQCRFRNSCIQGGGGKSVIQPPKLPKFWAIPLCPKASKCLRPRKVFDSDLTKSFHVKRFCLITGSISGRMVQITSAMASTGIGSASMRTQSVSVATIKTIFASVATRPA